jgi:predicted acylesterase/phospholipase RssA
LHSFDVRMRNARCTGNLQRRLLSDACARLLPGDHPQAQMTPTRPRVDLIVHLPGAVSAGTYGAGVLDFLVEALDAFSEASRRGEAPAHDIVLTAIGGTSAGAQTALIFSCAIAYRFAPAGPALAAADAATIRAAQASNPFFEHWVVRNDLRDYLTTRDAPMRSLLDPTNVDVVADSVLRFGTGLPTVSRWWVANPLRLGIAVTNLRGIPSTYALGAGWGNLQFTRHADAIFFAVRGLGSAPAAPAAAGEDDLALPAAPQDKARAWSALGLACVASGAFPVVFAARTLDRPVPARDPVTTRFCAVDGGVFNSNPLDITARLVAAGGGNHRTVLLKVGSPSLRAPEGPSSANIGFWPTFKSLMSAMWREASGRPDASQQQPRPSLHATFTIAPQRPDRPGEPALAGSGLGGFAGYFKQAFREHDFLLGRWNARTALARDLCLPDDDPLFDAWTAEQKIEYALPAGNTGGSMLPLVPLVGTLRLTGGSPESLPAWPEGGLEADSHARAIRGRISHVLRLLHAPRKNPILRAVCTVLGWTIVPLLAWLATRCLLARLRQEPDPRGQ